MKTLLKKILIGYLTLQVLVVLIPDGFVVNGGALTFLKAVVFLTLIFPILRPLVKIIILPLSFLTLGLINFLLSLIFFYIMTLIVYQIQIHPQTYQAFSLLGFAVPQIVLSRFWTYVFASFLFSLSYKILNWLTSERE